MVELTTLQLARKIADAVFLALLPGGMEPNRNSSDMNDPPTQAVLRVLRDYDSWFCRIRLDADGRDLPDEPYEFVQPNLF